MEKFINRENEIKSLKEFWQERKPQFIIIYGKRRVGKTAIIKEFIKNKKAIYFLAKRVSEKDNLKTLAEVIGRGFGDNFLIKKGFDNWSELFSYLKERVKKRTILVIDEFPYLVEANKGVSSEFQAGWDEYLKDLPIFLILCGSSIAMMESETLSYKAPLYGRRTGQIFVKPLSFKEAREFLKNKSFEKALEFYSLAGGIPAYLLEISPFSSLIEAIKKKIFPPKSLLYQEIDFILKEELREPRTYFSILKAIAFSKTKFSEIINETGLDKSALHNYLFVLEDLHLIEKKVPVTEKNPLKSRRGLYFLKDQFFKFWFFYVFPYKSELELENQALALKKFKETFNLLVSQNYEKVAQEIIRKHQREIFPFQKIGSWWDKKEEIDLVALNEETKEILFGEVKWQNKKIGQNILKELKRKAEKVDWYKGKRKEYFCLFSKSGFTSQMKKLTKKEKIFLFEKDKLLK
jgi:AAA+ ATPase superfamily predicted ATPase